MLYSQPSRRLCYSCCSQLSCLFKNGFCSVPKVTTRLQYDLQVRAKLRRKLQARNFTVGKFLRSSNGLYEVSAHSGPITKSPAYMEGIVRRARETFGETLPTNFLSPEEYIIYERLYGPPTHTTRPEDVRLFQGLNEELMEDIEEQKSPRDALFRENSEGDWEEVDYQVERRQEEQSLEANQVSMEDTLEEVMENNGEDAVRTGEEENLINDHDDDFRARMTLYKDMTAANQALEPDEPPTEEGEAIAEDQYLKEEQQEFEDDENDENDDLETLGDFNDAFGEAEGERASRFHHLTRAGKFGTTPRTIEIPRATVVDPITALLADASTKQLKEVAQKVFGGPLLPNSTATPSSKGTHLQQQPIALAASQFHMGPMEANAYIAANIPGTYAAVMSTLEEVRKRVGAGWLRDLLVKEGGPRILDAGGGGAGALAWREILREEWERLHPNSTAEENPVPVGKSTVVTGSPTLRHRVRDLLENTTFLPRLPDYNPSLDHPSLENQKATPRKRYDIIVAPHTLWTLREDHMRKNQVQNFWSLLDPNGGILILIEKGVPRGFELIAGAREVLLKHHIASPGSETAENHIEEPFESLSREKEQGMIIAPCTNHLKCPLYLTHGANKGRKDYCHFSQRFNRPAFLQRLIGPSNRNHEDIKFSYVAVQRGVDQRQKLGIPQGQAATNAAIIGYEFESAEGQDAIKSSDHEIVDPDSPHQQLPFVHPLSLPRLVLPPLKRDKHVILDLCTPTGKLERWTVPRSFSKQGYRDARKARWGDLWALGAKTRVPRNIRIGETKRRTRERGGHKVGKGKNKDRNGDRGEEDLLDVGNLFEKRTKRGRKAARQPRMDRVANVNLDEDDDGDEDEDETQRL